MHLDFANIPQYELAMSRSNLSDGSYEGGMAILMAKYSRISSLRNADCRDVSQDAGKQVK
jgi:hypothetical protein